MSKNKLTIPSGWSQKSFRDCFQVAPKLEGLKKTEYQIVGTYPIIDQSQGFISAYTENNSLVQEKYPAIVFGDHTRILKYINFPYVLGNDGTKVFWEKEGNNLRFLYYVLVNLEIPNTGYNRHFKYLDSAKFLIPPKPEQQKIAEILGAVDEDIEKTEKVIRETEKLKRGMMRDLLTKGIGHTKFKTVRLGDVVEIINGKTPLRSRVDYWNSNDVAWFTVDDIRTQGRFISKTRQFITNKAVENAGVKILPTGTTLICCTASVGEYAYAEIPMATNQQFNGLVVKDNNKIDNLFIYYVMNSFKSRLEKVMGSTTFGFISTGTLANFEIGITDLEQQKQIAKILFTIDEKITINKQLKEKLITLKKGLMSDLLSGKVRTI